MIGRSLARHIGCQHARQISSNPAVEDIYDVAIVGGGMVGAALACALGR